MAALAAAAPAALAAGLLAGGAGAAGAAGTAGASGAAGAAGPARAAAPAWVARFVARTTRPKADTAWDYCVIVVERARVRPLEAVVLQRLFDAAGNPIAAVGQASFLGAWCQTIKLPASIRGQSITLETKVTADGDERRLRTPIRVT